MDANYLRAANSIGGHHPRKHAVSFYNTNLRHNTRRDNHPFRIHPRASQRHKSETPRAGITFRLSRRPPRRLPSAPSSPLWPCSWRSPFVPTSLEQHRLFRTSFYCTACLSDVHARSFRLIFAAITSLVSRRASSPLPPFPHRSINRLHFPDLSLRGAMAISPPFPIISARLSLTVAPRLHQASQCPVYTMSTTAIIIGEARLLNRAIQRRLLQVPPRVASCSGDTS